MNVEQAIRSRRTHKVYAGGAIDKATLEVLIEGAIWAPNHRYTEPWGFHVVHGQRALDKMNGHVQQVLDAMAKDAGQEAAANLAAKKSKMDKRLQACAAVIAVTWKRSPDDATVDREDYAATCCAIQNLLLAAHERGFVSLWSTSKLLSHPQLRTFYQLNNEHDVAGVIFLGTPVGERKGRRVHSGVDVTRWV
ncbi:MAG TPA: hypothetical protein DCQ06_11985 [Myxococcales bacterium]|nr:hypothetical protein [Myxococcales bacterium]